MARLRWDGDALRLKLPPGELRRARRLARLAGVRVRLEDRRGLPFFIQGLRARLGTVVGCLLAALALQGLTAVVWLVEVRGAVRLPQEAILSAARAAGLRPGRLRWGLDLNAVERRMLLALDELSWVGVELKGVVATVEVVEKDPPPPPPPPAYPLELVAACDGIVHTVLVFRGQALVHPGQVVSEGQVLIRPPPPLPGRPPHAAGLVRARVWYTGEAAVPLVGRQDRMTGRVHLRRSVRIAGRVIVLSGRRVPFELYESCRHVLRVGWRNVNLPVEFLTDAFFELERKHRHLSPDEAAHLAEGLAREQAVTLVPAQARILSSRVERTDLAGEVRVSVAVEVLEDIGLPRQAVESP